MSKSNLILISGSSGAGKNTIINEYIKKHNGIFLKSHTSRPKRADDLSEGNYTYVTKEEFENLIANNEIFEYDIFSGNYYGLSKNEINKNLKDNILLKDITLKGLLNCKESFDKKLDITSVFLTVDKGTLIKRLKLRKCTDIRQRLKVYKKEQSNTKFYDYIILNENMDYTLQVLEAIVNSKLNKLYPIAVKNTQQIFEQRIDKMCDKLIKNKKVAPIKAVCKENRIYIIDNCETYLASLRTKIFKPLTFDKASSIELSNINEDEWLKLVKLNIGK